MASQLKGCDGTALCERIILFIKCLLDRRQLMLKLVIYSGGAVSK